MAQFCIDPKNADPYKVYCIGVMMAVQTLKDFTERGEELFPKGAEDLEEAIQAYFDAARKPLLQG